MTDALGLGQMMHEYTRRSNESFTDYWIRLFEHKDEYGLTCDEIATLLNADQGVKFTECKWRKDFAMFNRGREYERKNLSPYVSERILCLSDFHVPFQLPLDTFSEYAGR